MRTKATTTGAAMRRAAPAASGAASPGVASTAANAWGATAELVERTHARLNRLRRLVIRYERKADIFLAFTTLGCALVCRNQIRQFCKVFLVPGFSVMVDYHVAMDAL